MNWKLLLYAVLFVVAVWVFEAVFVALATAGPGQSPARESVKILQIILAALAAWAVVGLPFGYQTQDTFDLPKRDYGESMNAFWYGLFAAISGPLGFLVARRARASLSPTMPYRL